MPNQTPECYVSFRVGEGWKFSIRKRICNDLPLPYEHEGKKYCILHYPCIEKSGEFEVEIKRRLRAGKYFFEGVYFPRSFYDLESGQAIGGMSFKWATFADEASFMDRTHSGLVDFTEVIFERKAYFRSIFEGKVYFFNCAFRGQADFSSSKFCKDVYFSESTFAAKTYFGSTEFLEEALFGSVIVKEDGKLNFGRGTIEGSLEFNYSVIHGRLQFIGGMGEERDLYETRPRRTLKVFDAQNSNLSLRNLTVTHPDQIVFKDVQLHPSWFADVDSRKFVFANIDWRNVKGDFKNKKILAETENLKDSPNASGRLSAACRDIAWNYEDKNDLRLASDFRYMALQTDRINHRFNGWFWTLDWFYWLSSGYGEKRLRAGGVLILLLALFSLLFSSGLTIFTNFPESAPKQQIAESFDNDFRHLTVGESIVYSLSVVTFQRPEPKPADTFTQLSVIALTFLVPLQFAFLAFSLRRKFIK